MAGVGEVEGGWNGKTIPAPLWSNWMQFVLPQAFIQPLERNRERRENRETFFFFAPFAIFAVSCSCGSREEAATCNRWL
jgi:hypothetical protein